MPYIKQNRRNSSICPNPINVGEINYQITKILNTYLQDSGVSYQTINDIIGALEGAKLEFYRRIVVPYEDKKIQENGDVYNEL